MKSSAKMMRHRFVTRDELFELISESRSIFQCKGWLLSVEDGLGYRPVGVLSEDTSPILLHLYFEFQKGPFRLIGSPLRGSMTPYLTPVLLKETDDNKICHIFSEHLKFFQKKGYSRVEWRFSEANESIEALNNNIGGKLINRTTFILKIKDDLDEMWNRMESRGRNMVRKAKKLGVSIRRCSGTMKEIELFYKMLKGTFSKSGRRPPHPISFYVASVKNLISANQLLFLAAEMDKKILAMGLFPHDKKEIHFMSGTSIPDAGKYAANNLIQWEVLRFAVMNSLKIYDMGGTGIPSIDRFKRSLGGEEHVVPSIVWQTPISQFAEKTYIRFKRITENIIT